MNGWLRTDREVMLEARIKELEAELRRMTAGGGTACSSSSTLLATDSSGSPSSSTEGSPLRGSQTPTECPQPGCPYPLTREADLPYLGCEMHGPMVPVCMECGQTDGRTACGALLCHDCKENE